tara:strand:+ start:2469 stop:2744 length:276 start_codon:yes stop_codon:yes gene_type:complete
MPYKDFKRRQQYRRENPAMYIIAKWKNRGIKLKPNEDWESVYLFYITCENCEECAIELASGRGATSRCLDHDHTTGFIRNVLCISCNNKRR